ncbi:S24/S26 family peptidase [Nonomuraea sp. NPDC048901]|uniref:S24/S26 family peptidase n=1 Tax=Nonomuraea sp. NPDC048901 TaxID=3155627 RepID=UPI00340A4A3D
MSALATHGTVAVPVTGASMLPTLRHGDRVTLSAVDPDAITAGDVIAFRADGRLVLHRVHALGRDRLITAGDHHLLFDPPVPWPDVVALAEGIPPRPEPSRWPLLRGPAPVDVWLVEPTTGREEDLVPPWWTLHRRPREGVCASAAVLKEIMTAVRDRPCVGVTEHAVHSAYDVLGPGGLPPGAQVLVGCSFGRLHEPMPGHLIPGEAADVFVRLGEPEEPLDAAETLRRLSALVAPSPRVTGDDS